MRHAVVSRVLRGVAVALVCLLAGLGQAPAMADPSPSRLVVATPTVVGSSVYVSGRFTSSYGTGIGGLAVYVMLDDIYQGTTVTGPDGTFSYSFGAPGPGSHIVSAYWSGDSRYGPASDGAVFGVSQQPQPVQPAPQVQRDTSLSISLDPTQASPGATIAISGVLTSNDSPVGSSLVSLSVDYGDIDSSVGTGDDGRFTALMALPDGDTFPGSFTVTASFAGDGVYIGSMARATGTIVAPPAPTASPSEEPTPTTTPTPTASATASSSSGTVGASSTSVEGSGSPMAVVSVIFFGVALVAIGALVVLGLVSHSHKRLARDERRGFGTDFGKER
ncbi:MAG: Ig-like domain-containing protein [Propionibacteriaceae bacterium]|nr:Ig-like domain-containing protein [Propionibacteriaceae bacterium]